MREAWNTAVTWCQMFSGDGMYQLLYLIALIFLLGNQNIEKKWKTLFWWYTIVALFLYFCPLTAAIMMKVMGSDVYWRVLWILPIPELLAFCAASAADQKKKGKTAAMVGLLVLVFMLGGKNLYQNGAYTKRANLQKVMAETIQIADYLEEQKKEGEELRVSMPDELICEIRQYDANIYLPYGRRINEYPQKQELWDEMNCEIIRPWRLHRALEKFGCGYVVLHSVAEQKEQMEDRGFRYLNKIGGYEIYKVEEQK